MHSIFRSAPALIALSALGISAGAVAAQSWPSQPIHIIVPYAAGGGTDATVRTLAPLVSEALGQPVVVENRPGGATIIATEAVYRADPDGYTLGAAAAPFTLNAALGIDTPYDPLADFAPIIKMVDMPACILVNNNHPATSFPELLDWARAQNEPMLFATAGVGSLPHLWMEAFAFQHGLDVEHVGYRGSAPALLDVIAGNIEVMVDGFTPGCQRGTTGEVRVLAVPWSERLELMPEVPTLAELGYEARLGAANFSIIAPGATDPAIVEQLNAAFQSALDAPEVHETLLGMGLLPAGGSAQDLVDFYTAEIAFWSEVVEQAGIQPE